MNRKKLILPVIIMLIAFFSNAQQKTYCNPINIDYGYTPIPNFSQWGNHRATADPVIVNYKGLTGSSIRENFFVHGMKDMMNSVRLLLESSAIQ